MNNPPPAQPAGFKLTPGDIIYTLFRHLRKIILFGILGAVAGAAVYKLWPDAYVSSAKLMIRFIVEDRGISDTEQATREISYGARGTGYIITGEVAILRSFDLAVEVAEAVGPARIINDPERDATATATAAAGKILANLVVDNPRATNMLNISVTHENRETAREIVAKLIELYQERHLKIHRTSGKFEDYATRETDQMRMRLLQTEEELQAERAKANIVSVASAKQSISSEIASIRSRLLDTQTALAETSTLISQQEASLKANSPAEEQPEAEEAPSSSVVSNALSAELREATTRFSELRLREELLRGRERQLSLQYTAENPQVRATRKQLSDLATEIENLQKSYPELMGLAEAAGAQSLAALDSSGNNVFASLEASRLNVVGLAARKQALETALKDRLAEAARIDQVELKINELERRKLLQESKYHSLLESAEKARVQEALGDGRVNNIGIVQSPSPAGLAASKKIQFAAGAAAGIGLIGLAWAFLVDLLLDRSIKRPTEIQRNLHIPLFMSLPDMSDKRFMKLPGKGADRALLLQSGKTRQQAALNQAPEYKPKSPTLQAAALSQPEIYQTKTPEAKSIAPWDDGHALNEHFEALRDKVITYFESKNLTHKPKLIALTSIGEESGVTTIASGLAGALSKVGEGNVLLVDMTLGQETAQQFYNGKNVLNLDEVLEDSSEARVENNLYVVAEGTNGMKLPRIMPQRFNKIMPKLRASDFDYIIFDMPPVSPISSTPRLASFMDVVLMVMESEKTNRDTAQQAIELLGESKAHLGGILNKTKSHVPKKLEQDLLSQA